MWTDIARGAAAGAAGTCALNAATYADMAVRGRPGSNTPNETVARLTDRAGVTVPGDDEHRSNRLSGLGALSGIAVGVGIGAMLGALTAGRAGERASNRMPALLAGVIAGGGAMAATDVPMAGLGVSDPRTWSASSWLADVIPHLCYGLATVATLRMIRRGRGRT